MKASPSNRIWDYKLAILNYEKFIGNDIKLQQKMGNIHKVVKCNFREVIIPKLAWGFFYCTIETKC
jgi:hypothetical protein